VGEEWVRYRRVDDRPLEAMHARFEQHVYHAHSHDTYSFGVTEAGAQEFTCRGGRHISATGMVMAFNPDDPHDGRSAGPPGFTYRMVHIGPDLLVDVLAEDLHRPARRPLFAEPVLDDRRVAAAVRRLHGALLSGAPALVRDELLASAVDALHRRAMSTVDNRRRAAPALAARVREHLDAVYLDDIGADELARAAGHSRFAVSRAFRAAYAMSPSEYQRQLRLRAARRMLAKGVPPAHAAAAAGFADQAHLNRWFVRSFGLTPGAFRRAAQLQ
jgi:AraC-like DNA-binding protein